MPFVPDLQADAARTMARRVVHAHLVVAEVDRRHVVEDVDRGRLTDLEAEQRALLHGAFVEEQVVPVQIDRHVVGVFRRADAGDVIDVRVGQQDRLHLDVEVADSAHQLVDLVAGIDDHRFARPLAADDEAVLVEGRDGPNLEKH